MTSDVDHVVLTRFNLPSIGVESIVRAQDNWLRNRWTLFETYCLPSMRLQTATEVVWIIYFDPESPDWLRERVDQHTKERAFRACFRASVSNKELVSDITDAIGRPKQHLITTNLDNDDGLARDFLQRISEFATPHSRAAIYVENGLIKTPDALYLRRDRRNAFCSVREEWASPITCWSDWHNLLEQTMPAEVIAGEPGWLQVVHGQNVSNRARGLRVSPDRYRSLFPGLLEDVARPRPADLARDRFLVGPVRLAKEGGRATVKNIGMRILGKDGWDQLKHSWRTRRT